MQVRIAVVMPSDQWGGEGLLGDLLDNIMHEYVCALVCMCVCMCKRMTYYMISCTSVS